MRSPVRVRATNFLCYAELDVDLSDKAAPHYITATNKDKGDVADSNGSGKSSLLASLTWGLYGKTLSGLKRGEVKTHDATHVRVEVDLGDVVVQREYTRKHRTLRYYWKSTGEEVAGDIDEVQRKLERHVLGIDYDGFLNTCVVYKGSSSVQFLRAQPNQRAKLLGSLIDDRVYVSAALLISTDLKLNNDRINKSTTRLTVLNDGLISANSNLASAQNELRTAMEEEQKRRAATNIKIGDINRELKKLTADQLSQSAVNGKELQKEVHRLSALVKTAIENCAEEKAKVPGVVGLEPGEVCPTCLRTVSDRVLQEMESKRKQAKEKLKDSLELKRELEQRHEAAKKKQENYFEWKRERQRVGDRIEELNELLLDYKDRLNEDRTAALRRTVTRATQTIKDYSTEIKTLEDELIKLKEKQRVLKILEPMARDIKNILFDDIRGELASHTNYFAQALAGTMFSVRYPTKDRLDKEKFEIMVWNDGIEQDVAAFSEGESWRINCAILFALRRTMLLKSQSKLDFVLVDDPVQGLDKAGKKKFFSLLDEIQGAEKNLMLIAVPDEDDLPYAPRIRHHVTKKNKLSKVRTTCG